MLYLIQELEARTFAYLYTYVSTLNTKLEPSFPVSDRLQYGEKEREGLGDLVKQMTSMSA